MANFEKVIPVLSNKMKVDETNDFRIAAESKMSRLGRALPKLNLDTESENLGGVPSCFKGQSTRSGDLKALKHVRFADYPVWVPGSAYTSRIAKKRTPSHIVNHEIWKSQKDQNKLGHPFELDSHKTDKYIKDQLQESADTNNHCECGHQLKVITSPESHVMKEINNFLYAQTNRSPSFSPESSPSNQRDLDTGGPSTPVPQKNNKFLTSHANTRYSDTYLTPEVSSHLPCRPPLMVVHSSVLAQPRARYPLRRANEMHECYLTNICGKSTGKNSRERSTSSQEHNQGKAERRCC